MKTGEGRIYLTTKHVAEQCGVSKSTVIVWLRDGMIPSIRLPSGHYRIHKDDLQKFLESLQPNSAPAQNGPPVSIKAAQETGSIKAAQEKLAKGIRV